MNKTTARTAGLLYLIVVLTGMFSLAYVPSHINLQADASTTAREIVASGSLFRFGIVASLVCYTVFLLLPFALYKLLSPVGRNAALLMVAFAVVSVPISLISVSNRLDIVSLLSRPEHLRVATSEQLHDLIMLSLDRYRDGMVVANVFWGLWLLPFGYLVFKCGFLPRTLGILLIGGCFGDLIDVVGNVIFRGYSESVASDIATLPGAFGEIGTCLWLLIMGAPEAPRGTE